MLAAAKDRLDPDDPRGHELVEDMVRIAAQNVRDRADEHERVVRKEWQNLTADEVGYLRFLTGGFVTAALRGMI